jgi:hypothetical protein
MKQQKNYGIVLVFCGGFLESDVNAGKQIKKSKPGTLSFKMRIWSLVSM